MMCKIYVAALLDGETPITAFVSATNEGGARELLKKKFNAQILKVEELGEVLREDELPGGYVIGVLLDCIRGEDDG